MLVFDLRWTLFFLLTLLLLVGGIALWVSQWWLRRQQQVEALHSLVRLLQQAPMAVATLEPSDTGQICRYANPLAQQLLELQANQAIPSTEWSAHLRQDVAEVQQKGDSTGRYRTVALSATQRVRWWVTGWQGGSLLLANDISSQQQAEQNATLLLSDLSHELRTPLATLLTHLEVLRLPTLSNELRSESLRFMKEETQRLVRLVNNALELGRLRTQPQIEVSRVDLLTLVEATVSQLRPEAEQQGIQVMIESSAILPPALGRSDQLKQVFLNLIENAIKFSRKGDRVTIILRYPASVSKPNNQLEPSDIVYCAVKDSGPGIPAAYLANVTRKFYRAAPSSVAGSGLGLALVTEILRQHDSQLDLQSCTAEEAKAGETTGTTASFLLPAVNP